MDKHQAKRISKFLSFVLRHEPESIGIELDEAGWVSVDTLLDAMRGRGKAITRDELNEVVRTNDKQRFAFSEDGTQIRASQGHSIQVDLGYASAAPPQTLYHGTVERFLESIRQRGLAKGRRHHVHLSSTVEQATIVGQRRGKPVVLTIRAEEMHQAGHEFFVTPNGVWLAEHVPPEFIDFC